MLQKSLWLFFKTLHQHMVTEQKVSYESESVIVFTVILLQDTEYAIWSVGGIYCASCHLLTDFKMPSSINPDGQHESGFELFILVALQILFHGNIVSGYI